MVKYACCVGIDWSHGRHALALCGPDGSVESGWVGSKPEEVHSWAKGLHERFGGRIAVGVELAKGALVEELRMHDFIDIYSINPSTSSNYRRAFTPSGAKGDIPDAIVHLELVMAHRHKLEHLRPAIGIDRRLRLLSIARRRLVDLKKDLCNTLRSTLRDYFPLALEVCGTLGSPLCCKFLSRWPQLGKLKRARPDTLRAFYKKCRVRNEKTIESHLEKIAVAEPLSCDCDLIEPMAALASSLNRQIMVLRNEIETLNQKLEEAYESHPDRTIWSSFPGAGSSIAPRIASSWGCDREVHQSANQMQAYSGIAPVTESSGNSCWVHRRFSRPHFLHQTMWEYAKQSCLRCEWAKRYVQAQIQRGKKHATAIRSLAFKWIRIMYACWKNHEPYDESRYISILREKGSKLVDLPEAA